LLETIDLSVYIRFIITNCRYTNSYSNTSVKSLIQDNNYAIHTSRREPGALDEERARLR